MFWHAWEYHRSIHFLFVLDITIHAIALVEHKPGEPGINFLFPCVPPIFLMFPQCMLLRPWEGKFCFPFFRNNYFSITYITILFFIFPTPMISHRCFIEEYFSGGKINFSKLVRVYFGTPNFTIISKHPDLSNILLSHAWQISHSVYVWPWTNWMLRLVLTHLCICWL